MLKIINKIAVLYENEPTFSFDHIIFSLCILVKVFVSSA